MQAADEIRAYLTAEQCRSHRGNLIGMPLPARLCRNEEAHISPDPHAAKRLATLEASGERLYGVVDLARLLSTRNPRDSKRTWRALRGPLYRDVKWLRMIADACDAQVVNAWFSRVIPSLANSFKHSSAQSVAAGGSLGSWRLCLISMRLGARQRCSVAVHGWARPSLEAFQRMLAARAPSLSMHLGEIRLVECWCVLGRVPRV